MDSPDEFDVDKALNEELDKYANANGYDPAEEARLIDEFRRTRDPAVFEDLYFRHQNLIGSAIRNAGSSTLPSSAVNAHALKWYIHALDTYDPEKAQFKTHFTWQTGRLGRYRKRYENVGRIVEDRSKYIPLLQTRERELSDMLGRAPTNDELAEDMFVAQKEIPRLRALRALSAKEINRLRREVRKDYMADTVGPDVTYSEKSKLMDTLVLLHGSLSPEAKLILEHTYGDTFGKEQIEDPAELGRKLNLTPQKVRALRSQILRKAERYL